MVDFQSELKQEVLTHNSFVDEYEPLREKINGGHYRVKVLDTSIKVHRCLSLGWSFIRDDWTFKRVPPWRKKTLARTRRYLDALARQIDNPKLKSTKTVIHDNSRYLDFHFRAQWGEDWSKLKLPGNE